MILGLTDETVKIVIDYLYSQEHKFEEPMESFESCNKNKLISCLKSPFLRPQKKDRFEDFLDKSAMSFYLLIENHPLINGNKRLAVHCLLMVAYVNNYSIETTNIRLYAFAMVITYLNKYVSKDTVMEEIDVFLREVVRPVKIEKRIDTRNLIPGFKAFLLSNQ